MPEPHRIRLRRPWRREISAAAVCWRRHFNRPTGLGADHQVWLVWQAAGHPTARVLLNGIELCALDSSGPDARFNISGQLAARNELMIEIAQGDRPPEGDAPPGEIALEITV